MHAAAAGQNSTVKFLLDKKADPNITDNMKWTSLHHAVNSGGVGVTKLLVEGNDFVVNNVKITRGVFTVF